MKNFMDGKVRKLNYIVHNPNMVEETAEVLLEICIQANEGKVERKLRMLAEYNEGINVLDEKMLRSLKVCDSATLFYYKL